MLIRQLALRFECGNSRMFENMALNHVNFQIAYQYRGILLDRHISCFERHFANWSQIPLHLLIHLIFYIWTRSLVNFEAIGTFE